MVCMHQSCAMTNFSGPGLCVLFSAQTEWTVRRYLLNDRISITPTIFKSA